MDFFHTRFSSTIEITKEGKKLLYEYLGLIRNIVNEIKLLFFLKVLKARKFNDWKQ